MDEIVEGLAAITRDYKRMLNSLDNMIEETEDMQDALGMPRKRTLVPPMRTSNRPVLRSTTQQPRQLQRKATYSNKALMLQQVREIKSVSLPPQHKMRFDEEYNALSHDPAQQETMVSWYYERLRNGRVGF